MSQNNHPYQGIWFSVLVPADSESDQVQANIVLRHIRSVENLKAVVHQCRFIHDSGVLWLLIRAETSSHNVKGTIDAVRSRAANHCVNIARLWDEEVPRGSSKPRRLAPSTLVKFVEEPDIEWL